MEATESFVHLHVHSEYSLLDGACRIAPLVAQIKAMGQTAVAVTDHGNLYAAVLFYEEAVRQGIRPIIGCEMYVAQRTRFDKEVIDRKSYHLVLLCENTTGYRNLMKLVSLANLEGFYQKPRVDEALLRQYHEGLICLSACIAGEIPQKLLNGDFEGAKETAMRYESIFGKGNFYLEVQNHGISEEQQVLPLLVRLSHETGIPLVATNDVHYLTAQDATMQKAMLCIQTGKTMNEPNGMGFSTNTFYLRTTEEMQELFRQIPEAVSNTVKIAKRCQVTFRFGEYQLPHFNAPDIPDHAAYLRKLCYKGMYRRYGNTPDEKVVKRLEHELRIIESMGFVDYFLIVWDFIRYARSQDIPVGPGRGSGAGSLCAYCIAITNIDPIAGNLLFERFLNPERRNMPDFDIDFCIEGRARVKEYVVKRYGSDHVSEIITFDTLKARAAVRDIGRAMEVPYAICDRVAKQIDSCQTIGEALDQNKTLHEMYEKDLQIRRLLDLARKVEGMPRHTSVHAAGVVIAASPIMDYVPLQKNEETIITQYTMTVLERLGLLKMDFLGLRNLTIIRDAVRAIRKHTPDFYLDAVPQDDAAVFRMLSKGDTSGVFQLESGGMRNFITRLKPENMEDIIAALALFRPGPMDSIPTYIQNRRSRGKIQYLHPMLEEILNVTNGCIIYQEQVMQICRKLAGYSYGRADLVCRLMKKKNIEAMQKERQVFLYGSSEESGCIGAVANGIPEETANQIFDQMESFASYAFTKAHAAAYALLAYQTAYLKCHYFGDYMAALMTSVITETSKLLQYLKECRKAGISVCPPDVNTGEWGFVYRDGKLFYGLLAIRTLGRGLIDKMIQERQQNGVFLGFVDFCRRMSGHGLNKRTLEAMIQAGALDCLDANRRQMILNYESVMDAVGDGGSSVLDGQMSLFGEMESTASDLTLAPAEEYDLLTRLRMEKQVTGMYLSGHPMSAMQYLRDLMHGMTIGEITTDKGVYVKDKQPVKLFGIVQEIKKHRTRGGEDMCFLTLEDMDGTVEVVVFPKLYQISAARLHQDAVLYVSGRVSKKDDGVSVICESILEQEELPRLLRQMQLCLKITCQDDLRAIDTLRELEKQHHGDTGVVLYIMNGSAPGRYAMPKPEISVEVSESLYLQLCHVIPAERIGCISCISSQN